MGLGAGDIRRASPVARSREIDPSLPPPPFDLFFDHAEKTGGATFQLQTLNLEPPLNASRQSGRNLSGSAAFLKGERGVPSAELVGRKVDKSGTSWIALDGALNSFAPESDDPGEYRGLEEWCQIHSWFVPVTKADRATTLLLGAVQSHTSEVLDTHGHGQCCYLGEMGWRQADCYNRHIRSVELPDPKGQPLPIYITAEPYSWEDGFDCSMNGTVSVTAPSAIVLADGPLRWNGDQPVWIQDSQVVSAFVGRHGLHENHLLMLREDWLREFLKRNGFGLVIAVRGERRKLAAEATYREPWLEFASAVPFTNNGQFGKLQKRSKLNPGQVRTVRTPSKGSDEVQP